MVTGATRRGNQGRRERDEGGTRRDWQEERREKISKHKTGSATEKHRWIQEKAVEQN